MSEIKVVEPRVKDTFDSLAAKGALKSRPLCIAGMHRSGTSLTTSWFARCGLHVGDDLGPANQSNPKGHFEDQDFVLFQANAVGRMYPKSFGWKVTEPTFIRFNDEEEFQAREFVKERSKEHPFWGWKDPRSVLFLEHWREISPETRFFLVWRSHVDVVESLIKRARTQNIELTQVTIAQSLRIWIAYNKLVAEFKQRYPKECVLVSAETIQSKPEQVFNQLRDRLSVNLEYQPFTSVLDKNIWHQKREPSFRVKFLATVFGADKLEAQLNDLCDVK